MSRLTIPGQRSLQPPARASADGRTAMRTGTGIILITTGAILLFALTGGSPHWLNLHVVGVILILTGALGLLLPRLSSGPLHRGRLRRWDRPAEPADPGPAPARAAPGSYDDRPAPATGTTGPGDSPTKLDDLLSYERPQP